MAGPAEHLYIVDAELFTHGGEQFITRVGFLLGGSGEGLEATAAADSQFEGLARKRRGVIRGQLLLVMLALNFHSI